MIVVVVNMVITAHRTWFSFSVASWIFAMNVLSVPLLSRMPYGE